jgi:hypothetical protein
MPHPQLFFIHPYTLDKSAKYVQRKEEFAGEISSRAQVKWKTLMLFD